VTKFDAVKIEQKKWPKKLEPETTGGPTFIKLKINLMTVLDVETHGLAPPSNAFADG
jgi:hypothetical protein